MKKSTQSIRLIKHLESVLKRMDEKQQTLVSRLVKVFREDLVKNQHVNLSDEEFMKVIEQLDESELSSPPFSELQSTECTKVGKKCIKFMSYGQL